MNTHKTIGISMDYFNSLPIESQLEALEMASKPNLYRWAEQADQPTVRVLLRKTRALHAFMQSRREAALALG